MRCRIAFFTPDPFVGKKFAVGFLVGDDKYVEFHRNYYQPCAQCLGNVKAKWTLDLILQSADELKTFAIQPGQISQLFSFGNMQTIASYVDALAFVRNILDIESREMKCVCKGLT